MHKIISTIIILLFPILTFCQVNQSGVDTLKNWELGLDLLWLIHKNKVPSTSIFVRYNYLNENKEMRAWRFRLGLDNSSYDSAQIDFPRYNEIDIFSPYVRVGHEWQFNINEKVSYFYGVDVSTLYSKYKSEIVLYPGPNLLQVKDITWKFEVIPFIGLKYRPVKWLAISTECSFNICYRIRREKHKVTDIDTPNSSGFRGKIDVNDFSIQLTPITVVNLSFYLPK